MLKIMKFDILFLIHSLTMTCSHPLPQLDDYYTGCVPKHINMLSPELSAKPLANLKEAIGRIQHQNHLVFQYKAPIPLGSIWRSSELEM